MTLNEIIYDIREKLKLNSDDIDITNEYLTHLVNVKRVFLLKQRFNKFTRNIPEEVKQLVCINLEVVNRINNEPCFGDILKSKSTIPSTMEIGGRSSIIGIRVNDILYPHINIIPVERLPFVGYNKWLKKQIYVALDADNNLYFKSDNPMHLNLESVKIIGVFSNPKEAESLNCTSTIECEYEDKEYPIEPYLVNDVVNLIAKELGATLTIPNDNVNDASERV